MKVLARYSRTQDRVLLTDALQSVIALADNDGWITTRYDYSPYGETRMEGLDGHNSLQYTGREHDGHGLYYYRARYYDPQLKRFLSPDPIGLLGGGVNYYAYVGNNPVNLIDPEGTALVVPVLTAVVGGAVGVIAGYAEGGARGAFRGAIIGAATGALGGIGFMARGTAGVLSLSLEGSGVGSTIGSILGSLVGGVITGLDAVGSALNPRVDRKNENLTICD